MLIKSFFILHLLSVLIRIPALLGSCLCIRNHKSLLNSDKRLNLSQKSILSFLNNNKSAFNGIFNFRRLSIYNQISDDDLNNEISNIYSGLKDKKWTFNDLQSKLLSQGITLEGCHRPDDVIKRLAQFNLLGKEGLEQYLQDNDPEFSMNYIKSLQEYTNEYENLSKGEKESYINSILDKLKDAKIKVKDSKNHTNILDTYARFQTSSELLSRLPTVRPENEGAQNVESYKNETESIMNVYNKAKSNTDAKNKLMKSVCDELDVSNADRNDCKTDEQLINRLAYVRVYPKEPKGRKLPSSRRRVIQSGPLRTIFNIQTHNLGDIFPSSGTSIFDGFFGDEFQSEGMLDGANIGGGFSILKDIASMFGLDSNITGNGQQQIQFQNEEPNRSRREPSGKTDVQANEERDDDFIETDPELLTLQRKAQLSGDNSLQTMVNKAIKDPNLRNVLKMAATKGYQHARDMCSGDKTALYILDKLNDKHLWT